MSWPALSFRYRHTVYALLIATVIFGVAARINLPVQLFPDTDPPVVTVITPYPGLSAPDVARSLSKLLEEELIGIDGIRRVASTSQTGLSVVKAEFQYGRETAAAAVDVQNAVGRIRHRLPAGIGEPQVLEFSSADKPIITVALKSELLPLHRVRELAENQLRDRLQLVAGVAAVDIFGGWQNRLEVAVDPALLQAYGQTMEGVKSTLRGWNLLDSGGMVSRTGQELVVRFDAPLTEPEAVAELLLERRQDRDIRLGDVARVALQPDDQPRAAYRFNGEPAIALQILKRSEANTVTVAGLVRTALAELGREHPGLKLEIADDDSIFTEVVINNMNSTILTAILLTLVVILLFLGNLRQALIVGISIPVAFLLTFVAMSLSGIDLNMVTMSAIILAIGMLVDGAVVVIENVERHLAEPGATPKGAAIAAAEELLQPLLAGLSTTVAVLLPMAFLGGFVGRLFGPLAWTILFALTSSFLVTMTLVPLLAAAWLKPEAGEPTGTRRRRFNPGPLLLDHLRDFYLATLNTALKHPGKTLLLVLLLLLGSGRIIGLLGSEMLPRFDSGNFQFTLDLTPGTPLATTATAVAEIEKALLAEPSVVGISSSMGYEAGARSLGDRGAMDGNQAQLTVNLTPRNQRQDTMWQVMERTRLAALEIPGVTLAVPKEKGGTARSTTAAPLTVRISGPDPEVLVGLAREVLGLYRTIPGVTSPYANWALDNPQLEVTLDPRRAAELGLDGKQVAATVYRALEGETVTALSRPDRRDLEVVVRYRAADRRQLGDLAGVRIPMAGGGSVPLRELAVFSETMGPRIITREDLEITLEVLAYNQGRPLSQIVGELQAGLAAMTPPAGYHLEITGEQSDFEEARGRMLRALLLGALAVYLILLAQFRSFLKPLTLMAAIPLQFIGVALALLLAGKVVSMPALLGIIMLVGTVVNNSIVLLTFAQDLRATGLAMPEALRRAVAVRCRPIMMTTFSTAAGMLPLALELAVGAERFSPIATVIIGGLTASTLLTMVVIPVLANLTDRR
ncbi:MAG: efflux RND transporter permease subunit [Desulfurivibrio sp.]